MYLRRKFLHISNVVIVLAVLMATIIECGELTSWQRFYSKASSAAQYAPAVTSACLGLYGLNNILSQGISRENIYATLPAIGLIASPLLANRALYYNEKQRHKDPDLYHQPANKLRYAGPSLGLLALLSLNKEYRDFLLNTPYAAGLATVAMVAPGMISSIRMAQSEQKDDVVKSEQWSELQKRKKEEAEDLILYGANIMSDVSKVHEALSIIDAASIAGKMTILSTHNLLSCMESDKCQSSNKISHILSLINAEQKYGPSMSIEQLVDRVGRRLLESVQESDFHKVLQGLSDIISDPSDTERIKLLIKQNPYAMRGVLSIIQKRQQIQKDASEKRRICLSDMHLPISMEQLHNVEQQLRKNLDLFEARSRYRRSTCILVSNRSPQEAAMHIWEVLNKYLKQTHPKYIINDLGIHTFHQIAHDLSILHYNKQTIVDYVPELCNIAWSIEYFIQARSAREEKAKNRSILIVNKQPEEAAAYVWQVLNERPKTNPEHIVRDLDAQTFNQIMHDLFVLRQYKHNIIEYIPEHINRVRARNFLAGVQARSIDTYKGETFDLPGNMANYDVCYIHYMLDKDIDALTPLKPEKPDQYNNFVLTDLDKEIERLIEEINSYGSESSIRFSPKPVQDAVRAKKKPLEIKVAQLLWQRIDEIIQSWPAGETEAQRRGRFVHLTQELAQKYENHKNHSAIRALRFKALLEMLQGSSNRKTSKKKREKQ